MSYACKLYTRHRRSPRRTLANNVSRAIPRLEYNHIRTSMSIGSHLNLTSLCNTFHQALLPAFHSVKSSVRSNLPSSKAPISVSEMPSPSLRILINVRRNFTGLLVNLDPARARLRRWRSAIRPRWRGCLPYKHEPRMCIAPITASLLARSPSP